MVEATPMEFVLWSFRKTPIQEPLMHFHSCNPCFSKHKTSIFTSFTAPELAVHIALVLAKPTVGPSKSTPLNEEEGKRLFAC